MELASQRLKEQAQVICTDLCSIGEQSFFLSVNPTNQTSTFLGSTTGMDFLQKRMDIIEQFYKICSGQEFSVDDKKKDAQTMTDDTAVNQIINERKDALSSNKNISAEPDHPASPECFESLDHDLSDHNNSMGDIFAAEEKGKDNSAESTSSVSEDKNVKINDGKVKTENLERDSSTWKSRLTRTRKPSAVMQESYHGFMSPRHKETKLLQGYMSKIGIEKSSQLLDSDVIEKSSQPLNSDVTFVKEETGSVGEVEVSSDTRDVIERYFHIYSAGKRKFRNVTETVDENEQQYIPTEQKSEITVKGSNEAGFFVNFEDVHDDIIIIKDKPVRKRKRKPRKNTGEVFERTSDGRFICSYCGKICRTKTWLLRHRLMHTGEKPLKCDICGKTYRQYGHLIKHKISHNPGYRPHMCDVCGKTFSYLDSLKTHKRLHQDTEPLVCPDPDCGKIFARPELLKQHLKYKRSEFDHMCDTCGRTFKQKDGLRKHMETHKGDKREIYQCTHCNKTFFKKQTYTVHVNNHLGVYQYVCDCCNIVFSSSSTLNKHKKSKAGLLETKKKSKPRKTLKNAKYTSTYNDDTIVTKYSQYEGNVQLRVPVTIRGETTEIPVQLEDGSQEMFPITGSNGEEIIYVIDTSGLNINDENTIVTTS